MPFSSRLLLIAIITGTLGRFAAPSAAAEPLAISAPSLWTAPAAAGPSYFQVGVGNTPEDDAMFTGTQGVSTQIYVTSDQRFDAGAFHFFWAATGLDETPGKRAFVQIGYAVATHGGPLVPFIFSNNSVLPAGNTWSTFAELPLIDEHWYTFTFQTTGIRSADGSYPWTFTMQPQGGATVLLATLPFATKNSAQGPYLVSEVAGAQHNACLDSFSVAYGMPGAPAALLALKDGTWRPVTHGRAFYGYGPCREGNVSSAAFQQVSTTLGPHVRQTSAAEAPVWFPAQQRSAWF